MLKRPSPQSAKDAARYEILAHYRRGWTLIRHRETGKTYLRRMFRGQYEVTAVRDGAAWSLRAADTGERVYPDRLA